MQCPYCGKDQYPQNLDDSYVYLFDESSTGSVPTTVLAFDSGRTYIVPVLLVHYIIAHEYRPPAALIGDIMQANNVPIDDIHPAIISSALVLKTGPDYPYGETPAAFPWRLKKIMDANKNNHKLEPAV